MRENMNISVNGQSRVPPGFRFHPTEEELLQYYLRKKLANQKIDLEVIFEVDLNKLEPWDIQERCKIGSTPQNEWYFFSHKDKKYPTGTRTNRATVAGFWKATGRDKVICSNGRRMGMRKTLVFYKGRAPHGLKSDWIMHEYRLNDTTHSNNDTHVASAMNGETTQEEGWVVCRIFKKKNHAKAFDSPINTPSSTFTSMLDSSSDHDQDPYPDHHDQGALEQIFQLKGAKPQKNNMMINTTRSFQVDKSMKLQSLESPTIPHAEDDVVLMARTGADPNSVYNSEAGLTDWAALDRFVATYLNGQAAAVPMASIFSPSSSTDHQHHDEIIQLPSLRSSPSTSSEKKVVYQSGATLDHNNNYGGNEIDLWSFTRSSSSSLDGVDPLCHVSDVGL